MPWAYLDDHFDEHPKVARAGPEAAWLFVRGLLYCRRNLTGGVIAGSTALELAGNKRRSIERLITVRLWEQDGDDFRVHDYEQWNHSEKKVRQARDAARKRWASNATACADGHADADATACADAMPTRAPARGTPFPIPQALEQSSSSEPLVAPLVDDDELLDRTWRVLALRHLAKREAEVGSVGSRDGWLRSVQAGLPKTYGDEARALLASEGGWSPETLADALEPPPPEPVPKPPDPLETTAAAAARLREKNHLPDCTGCDSTGWVDTENGVVPCEKCERTA